MVNGRKSVLIDVVPGIPKGIVLALLLFILHSADQHASNLDCRESVGRLGG